MRDALVQQQPAIEAAQAAQLPRDGAGIDVVAAQVRHEAADVGLDGRQQQRAAIFEMFRELLQIAGVGLAGGRAHAFFDAQIADILAHRPGVSGKFLMFWFPALYACPHSSIISGWQG